MGRSIGRWATVLAALLLAAGAATAADAPEDPPADFTMDISAAAGAPLALVFSTQSVFWQLQQRGTRPGIGISFFTCMAPAAKGHQGRVFIDVEPLGDRKVAAALGDFVKGVATTIKGDEGCELQGQPTLATKAEQFAFGKTKYKGYRLNYDLRHAPNPDPIHVVGVVLEVGKALVEIHTERYSTTTWIETALSSIKFVPLPVKSAVPAQVKIVENTGGLYRYIIAKLPPRWSLDPVDGSGFEVASGNVAHWTRKDPKTGQIVSRVTLIGQVVGKDFDLAAHAADRRINCQSEFLDVSEPAQVPVGASIGYAITYTNPKGPGGLPSKARRIVTRLGDMSVLWTLDTAATDEKEIAADDAAFDALLATVKTWTAGI